MSVSGSVTETKIESKDKDIVQSFDKDIVQSFDKDVVKAFNLTTIPRCTVSTLHNYKGKMVKMVGYVQHVRGGGASKFIMLRDTTIDMGERDVEIKISDESKTFKSIPTAYTQCVLSGKCVKLYNDKTMGQQTRIAVVGVVRQSFDEVKNELRTASGLELQVESFEVLATSDADYSTRFNRSSSVEVLANERCLVLRQEKQMMIFTVFDKTLEAYRFFVDSKGSKEVMPSQLSTMACEGTSSLMAVKYFDHKNVYLTQSLQLYLEILMASMGQVFTIQNSFRAEKSRTRRHQTEFCHAEEEIPDMMTLDQLIEYIEEMIVSVSQRIMDKVGPLVRYLNPRFVLPTRPFRRLTYHEAIKFCQDHDIKYEESPTELVDSVHTESKAATSTATTTTTTTTTSKIVRDFKVGDDLNESTERKILEIVGVPIVLNKFRTIDKAFYARPDPTDPSLSLTADFLLPGVGEVVGSGLRVETFKGLRDAIKREGLNEDDYQDLLATRKYGAVPSGGYGLGIQRFLMWMLNMPHIRDVTLFERTPTRVTP